MILEVSKLPKEDSDRGSKQIKNRIIVINFKEMIDFNETVCWQDTSPCIAYRIVYRTSLRVRCWRQMTLRQVILISRGHFNKSDWLAHSMPNPIPTWLLCLGHYFGLTRQCRDPLMMASQFFGLKRNNCFTWAIFLAHNIIVNQLWNLALTATDTACRIEFRSLIILGPKWTQIPPSSTCSGTTLPTSRYLLLPKSNTHFAILKVASGQRN